MPSPTLPPFSSAGGQDPQSNGVVFHDVRVQQRQLAVLRIVEITATGFFDPSQTVAPVGTEVGAVSNIARCGLWRQ
jgi:hypothetical protein